MGIVRTQSLGLVATRLAPRGLSVGAPWNTPVDLILGDSLKDTRAFVVGSCGVLPRGPIRGIEDA